MDSQATNTQTSPSKSEKRQLRRLSLLKKGGLFQPLPDNFQSKRATTVTELRSAYHLVYKTFLDQEFILSNPSKLRVRPWETSPDTSTFICQKNKDVVGVFSSINDSEELGLPSDKSFSEELDSLRSEGLSLCEMTNQAVLPEYRNSAICTELMQCVFAQAWHSDTTDLICAISPKQQKFFELIGFSQLGEIKSYSTVVYDPVALMRLDDIQNRWTYENLSNNTMKAFWKRFFIIDNPYMNTTPLWEAINDTLFANEDHVASIFEGCPQLFEDATMKQRAVLEKRLGLAASTVMSTGSLQSSLFV